MLRDLLANQTFDWLIVSDDDLLHALVDFGAHPVGAKLPIDPQDSCAVGLTLSKFAFGDLAQEHSIPTPPSGVAASIEEAATLASDIGYPVVIKGDRGFGGLEVRFAADRSHLSAACEPFLSSYGRVLVQRHVDGVPVSACVLYSDGNPLAFTSFRAECSYPDAMSASTVHTSFRHPDLREIVAAVGEATRFRGMLGIDFMYDHASGSLYAIEINPRPTIAFGGTAANRAFFAPHVARFLRGEKGPLVEAPDAESVQVYFPTYLFYAVTSAHRDEPRWKRHLAACLREFRLDEWRLALWQIARFCYDELGGRLPRLGSTRAL